MPKTLTDIAERLLRDASIPEEYLDSRALEKLEDQLEEVKALKDAKAQEKSRSNIEDSLIKLIEKAIEMYSEAQRREIEKAVAGAKRLMDRELDRRLRDI